jgi:hypothetical protein
MGTRRERFLKMHFMIAGAGPLDREEVLPEVVDF